MLKYVKNSREEWAEVSKTPREWREKKDTK
jgi:hypothetical protein